MNEERDKCLTEAMGECYHEWDAPNVFSQQPCKICGVNNWCFTQGGFEVNSSDNFSDWPGFGKLWEWAQKQDSWWFEFWHDKQWIDFIHPDRFANALYEFLKERERCAP